MLSCLTWPVPCTTCSVLHAMTHTNGSLLHLLFCAAQTLSHDFCDNLCAHHQAEAALRRVSGKRDLRDERTRRASNESDSSRLVALLQVRSSMMHVLPTHLWLPSQQGGENRLLGARIG